MENVKRLLEEMKKNPEAETLMKEYSSKDSIPECAEAILSVAQRLGIETQIDTAELAAYLEKVEASKKAATDQIAGKIIALDDTEAEIAVGGKTICGSRQMNEEHAMDCFYNDKCAWVWN